MPDSARELTSWKEIAAYLDVNVRTAQKWEAQRGLPVRRLPGGRRGRVAIKTDAIDYWRSTKPSATLPNDALAFRWPVDRDIIAEVRFIGGMPTSAHVGRLLDYLKLVRDSLT